MDDGGEYIQPANALMHQAAAEIERLEQEVESEYKESLQRMTQAMNNGAKANRLRAVLKLIAENGGQTTDEGVSCNGHWCAEQAREGVGEV